MDQSPSWEANSHSASQEIHHILWKPNIYYRVTFRNKFFFYSEELLAPLPTPKLEHHPLSAVLHCLLNIFAATLHIWRPFLYPQTEDPPCCGDSDPRVLIMWVIDCREIAARFGDRWGIILTVISSSLKQRQD
jgi:hypothetical protein